LVDFDRINAREIRFSIAAVNVRTGNFAYFDNAQMTIRPEHVMASSRLATSRGPSSGSATGSGLRHPYPT
jgi:predicted acylesterase/phospholipase RssA